IEAEVVPLPDGAVVAMQIDATRRDRLKDWRLLHRAVKGTAKRIDAPGDKGSVGWSMVRPRLVA
ncbi:MAG: hypothetical protein D6753_01125, partial [Planctomycetota bacterium]